MLIKKQAFKCLFKVSLWRNIYNSTYYFSIVLVKIWSHFYPETSWKYLLLKMVVSWGCISRRVRNKGEEGQLMSNLCLTSRCWCDMEKIKVPSSSNLNVSFSGAQQKFLLKRWKKNILHFVFLFFKIKCKGFSKIIGGRMSFLGRK